MKMNKKEAFKEMEEKALLKVGRYDYILLSGERNLFGAIIDDSGKVCIRNALIVAFEPEKRKVWKVENYIMEQCPEEFAACIKNLKKLAVCIGDREDDTSYHFVNDTDGKLRENFGVVGVVEAGEYIYAFCYDWKDKRNCCIMADCEGMEQADLYIIMKNLYIQGGETDGDGKNDDRDISGISETLFETGTEW